MLLDKECGADDDDAPYVCESAPSGAPQSRRPVNGIEGVQHPQHMDAGQHIGVGVQIVGVLEEPRAEVVVLHHRRAQVLSVGYQRTEDGGKPEGQHDAPHIPPEALGILDDQVKAQRQQKKAPRVIGNDKVLAEGDVFIDEGLGGPIVVGDEVLNKEKAPQIHRQIQAPPHMGVVLDEGLDGLHENPPDFNIFP